MNYRGSTIAPAVTRNSTGHRVEGYIIDGQEDQWFPSLETAQEAVNSNHTFRAGLQLAGYDCVAPDHVVTSSPRKAL